MNGVHLCRWAYRRHAASGALCPDMRHWEERCGVPFVQFRTRIRLHTCLPLFLLILVFAVSGVDVWCYGYGGLVMAQLLSVDGNSGFIRGRYRWNDRVRGPFLMRTYLPVMNGGVSTTVFYSIVADYWFSQRRDISRNAATT